MFSCWTTGLEKEHIEKSLEMSFISVLTVEFSAELLQSSVPRVFQKSFYLADFVLKNFFYYYQI